MFRSLRATAGATLLLVLCLAGTAQAAPADLDDTFGTGGRLLEAAGTETKAVLPVGGGKVVLVGDYSTGGVRGMWASRRLPGGGPDTAFGEAGSWRVVQFGALGCEHVGAEDAVRGPDGSLYLAGMCELGGGLARMAVAKLTPEGDLDTTFDGDGRRLVEFTEDPGDLVSQANAVALNTAGTRLFVGGQASAVVGAGSNEERTVRSMALAAIRTSDGALDTAWQGDGLLTLAFPKPGCAGDAVTAVEDLMVEPDGRITGVGTADVSEGAAIFRLLSSGDLDPLFNSAGGCISIGQQVATFGSSMYARAIAKSGAGSYVVAGAIDNRPAAFTVAGDGRVGAADAAPSGFGQFNEAAVDAQGRVLLAGIREGDAAVERRLPSAVLDPTFGRRALGLTLPAVATAVALDDAGRVVVGGINAAFTAQSSAFAARLAGGGPLPDAGSGTEPNPTPAPVAQAAPPALPAATLAPPPAPPAAYRILDTTVTRTMPDVVGKRVDDARDAILRAGLPADFAISYRHDERPIGDVVAADPARGRSVTAGIGTRVDVKLTVSVGPDLPKGAACPVGSLRSALRGADYDVALDVLKKAGCGVGDVTVRPVNGDDGAEIGKITRDTKKNVDVQITMSRDPAENDLFITVMPSKQGPTLAADDLRLQAVGNRVALNDSQKAWFRVQVVGRTGQPVGNARVVADTRDAGGPGDVTTSTGAQGIGTVGFVATKAGKVDVVVSFTGQNKRTIYGYGAVTVEQGTDKVGDTFVTASGLTYKRTAGGFTPAGTAAASGPGARAAFLGSLSWILDLFTGNRVPDAQRAAAKESSPPKKLRSLITDSPWTPGVIVTSKDAVGAARTTDARVVSAGGANVVSAGGANVVSAGGANVVSAGGANVHTLAKEGDMLITKSKLLSDNGLGMISKGDVVTLPNGANIIGQASGNLIGPAGGNLVGTAGASLFPVR